VVLDIESTGVWVEKDKIIEIALVKIGPDKKKEIFHKKVNPGISIPDAVTKLTGITNQDVQGAPSFREIAGGIFSFIGESDFAGFNVERFDLPLLEREFADAGISFPWQERKIYDAQKVFHLNEKRDLSAAYQFYCGKELTGAHSALVDSEAVYEILEKQIQKYGGGEEDLAVLDRFEYTSHRKAYDSEGKFCWWNGKLYPTFGKYRRKLPLEDLVKKDPGYLKWLLSQDFKEDVKSLVEKGLKGEFPKQAPAG